MTVWDFGNQPFATAGSPPQSRHVRFDPRFVEKHEPLDVESGLSESELGAAGGHVGAVLLGRMKDFFLKLYFNVRSATDKVCRLNETPNSSRSSRNVMSGRPCTNASIWEAYARHFGGVFLRGGRGAISPVSRRRCFNRRTHAVLT
jgi:hypothetical protein